jgi:hypothetical protein
MKWAKLGVMFINRVICVGLVTAILALIIVSCSKSTETMARKDQEKMFTALLGIEPTETVAEIKYKDVYNRYLMGGSWGRWMSFTFDENVFSEILNDEGWKQRDELRILTIESDAAPKWWPKVDQTKTIIYLRSDKDTPQSEGYSFEEYLWRDTNSNCVYFHRRYWN